MRPFTISALAAVIAVGFSAFQGASAADLPVKARPYQAPLAGPTWTGCYLGGNVGYGWAHKTWFDPQSDGANEGSGTADGIVGGGQIGCDYQVGNFVFGVQGMFDGADLTESHPFADNSSFTDHSKVSWFATLTGRIGYTITPVALAYIKGGAAWVHDKFTETCGPGNLLYVCPGEASATRTGWTLGGGLEYRFRPNWSVFAEYSYMNFGTHRSTLVYAVSSPIATYDYDIKQNLQNVVAGINYRF